MTEKLHPDVLDQLGLWTAIEWWLEQRAQLLGQVWAWRLDSALQKIAQPREWSAPVFLLVQEIAGSSGDAANPSLDARVLPGTLEIHFTAWEWGRNAGNDSGKQFVRLRALARSLGGELQLQDGAGAPGLTLLLPLPD